MIVIDFWLAAYQSADFIEYLQILIGYLMIEWSKQCSSLHICQTSPDTYIFMLQGVLLTGSRKQLSLIICGFEALLQQTQHLLFLPEVPAIH